ncbi:MAG: glycogen debranching enzyme family protein, partial [Candidatus Eremiobacteraeota bacterium]|nr:glycogen debranching enzyme family protein [Candidatus Eremiobacteraeota bacterium]
MEFGRSVCGDLAAAERREWLVTNGLGGYACGTIAGSLTRRYHGLLVAATVPPTGRTLLVAKAEESVEYGGQSFDLSTNHWRSGIVSPTGNIHIERFTLRGTVAVWQYVFADALLEKSIWMEHGANTTYVRYAHVRGREPIELALRILVNYRDANAVTRGGDWRMDVASVSRGIRVEAFGGATPFFVCGERDGLAPCHEWYREFSLPAESDRGLEDVDDHLCAALGRIRLEPGESFAFVATDNSSEAVDAVASLERVERRDSQLIAAWEKARPEAAGAPAWVRRCVLAADAFIVARTPADDPAVRSIVAGYPWFGDWARDAMIALPGLTLTTGRPKVAASILRTFAAFVDGGMLPNYVPQAGETPHYNAVDAPLWFIEAVSAYIDATADLALLRDLFPVLDRIVCAYRDGTRYGIALDPSDGLIRAGEAGVQLTWMDAKVGDRVVTPRIGKPVEIAALWYDATRRMATLAPLVQQRSEPYAALADRAAAGFGRFWNAGVEYCYDVLDGPDGSDATLRPNQLLAVSLPFSPLDAVRQRQVVSACGGRLFAATGLRSLD